MNDTNIHMEKTFEELKHLKAEYEQDLKTTSTPQERLLVEGELKLIVEAWHAKMPTSSS